MQENLNHFLHLPFAGMALSNDGAFGASGCIFINGNAALRCGEDRHSLGHPQFDRRLGVFQHELRFDRHDVWFMLIDNDRETIKNDAIAFC